jgi:hypothetical protein
MMPLGHSPSCIDGPVGAALAPPPKPGIRLAVNRRNSTPCKGGATDGNANNVGPCCGGAASGAPTEPAHSHLPIEISERTLMNPIPSPIGLML